jgi:hypothetical protein
MLNATPIAHSRNPTMRRLSLAIAFVLPAIAGAQSPSPVIPPAAHQIAAAVLPIPEEMRAGATVLGYGADGKMTKLREGTNDMICLASAPSSAQFHVACYHKNMEPFMARGRELRTSGVKGTQVDTVRFSEIKSGKLHIPSQPSALYSLTGPADAFDPATGTAKSARHLYVVYIPFATAATTGISAKPSATAPWIMFPGTPKAHIMFTPGM